MRLSIRNRPARRRTASTTRRVALALIAVGGALLTHSNAFAGPFGVSPLRLDLGGSALNTELTIHNQGQDEVAIQARVMRWSQNADGKDVLEPDSEIVVFPRITRIPAGERAAVRLALRGPIPPGPQVAYRVLVEELPSQATADAPVRFTLRVSVPLFVGAADAVCRAGLGEARIEGSAVHVPVRNEGAGACRFSNIAVRGADAAGAETFSLQIPGWYVLAGVAREFSSPLEAAACTATRSLSTVATEQGMNIEGTATVARADCSAVAGQ